MKADTIIRDARAADLEGLAAIRYADRPAIHRDRLWDAATRSLRFLVAEQGGAIVGFGLLVFTRPATWSDRSDSATADHVPQMIDLYVAEPFRGRGIGTSMIRHMEQLALQAGHDALFLSVDPVDNPRAHALYLRLGYQPLQTEPHHDHWRFTDSDGSVHEGSGWAVDMAKALK
jgi:GNAT superfamily N-acetyltransferase